MAMAFTLSKLKIVQVDFKVAQLGKREGEERGRKRERGRGRERDKGKKDYPESLVFSVTFSSPRITLLVCALPILTNLKMFVHT